MKRSYRYCLYIFIGILIVLPAFFLERNVEKLTVSANNLVIPYVHKNDIIVQSLNIKCKKTNKLGVRFATYVNSKKNSGYLTIKLINSKNDEILYEENVDVTELKDNQFFTISLKDEINSKSGEYYLEINAKNIGKETNLGIYGSYTKENEAILNKVKSNYSLAISYLDRTDSKQLLIYFVFYILIISMVECLRENKNERIKK